MRFPSTILAQRAEPLDIQKADLDLLAKINELARGTDSIITKDDVSYALESSDLPAVVRVSAKTADRKLILPAAAQNAGQSVWVVRFDTTAAYTVTIDGKGAEVIYNGGQSFAALEIDDAAAHRIWHLWCDGTAWYKVTPPTWHKPVNPATGWLASKTSWAVADQFTPNGLTVDFSPVLPLGSLAARSITYVVNSATADYSYWRKAGDTNISNTPVTSQEYSHQIVATTIPGSPPMSLWLSSAYAVEMTVAYSDADIYVAQPAEYLL